MPKPLSPASRALVILNPTSGQEAAADFAPLIEETLARHFSEIVIRPTEKAGDAVDFARDACRERVDAVFAVGGDGTVNEVLSGLAEEDYRPKLGIFPAGTFNAVARLLRIPLNLERAIRNFRPDLVLPVDLGRVNDRYFAYILSIGDIPETIHNVSIEEKTDSGILAYIKQITGRLGSIERYRLDVLADGTRIEEEVSHLVVLLADRLGPVRFMEDGAELSDGEMNLLMIEGSGFMDLLSLLPDFIAGRLEKNAGVGFRRVKRLEIRSDSRVNCDLDGEEGPPLPLQIEVLPRHIDAYYGSEAVKEDLKSENGGLA